MDYTKSDLEKKKMDELKSILKEKNLKITGNKPDLIDRILNSQRTYLELLPKDLSNLVEDYRVENNLNNKVLTEYLNLIKWKSIGTNNPQIKKDIDLYLDLINERRKDDFNAYRLNKFFKDRNLNIKFIEEEIEKYRRELVDIKIGKLPLISDELMAEILLKLVENAGSVKSILIDSLNLFLYDNNASFILASLKKNDEFLVIVMYAGKKMENYVYWD